MSDDPPMAGMGLPGPGLRPYPKMASKGKGATPVAREWVATEKVHGAHFALVCAIDESGEVTEVRPAKRRELLGEDDLDAFFGVSRIWPALSVAAARCAAALARGAVVTLYGELAGGGYPHPDITDIDGTQPVQTGIWYAPDLFWLLFDAGVTVGERRWWVADREVRTAAAEAGLLTVPVLARGPLKHLQELPAAFPSRVSALFGLPELADNLAEGYVLKPAGEWKEGTEGSERPLLKAKQKAFAEDERFAGARPYVAPPEGAAGVPAWLVVQAAALLTPARAAAAVSKLGPRSAIEVVAEEIAKDAAEEVAEDVGGLDPVQLAGLSEALLAGARTVAEFDAADRERPVRR